MVLTIPAVLVRDPSSETASPLRELITPGTLLAMSSSGSLLHSDSLRAHDELFRAIAASVSVVSGRFARDSCHFFPLPLRLPPERLRTSVLDLGTNIFLNDWQQSRAPRIVAVRRLS